MQKINKLVDTIVIFLAVFAVGMMAGMLAPQEPVYVEAPAILWQTGEIPIDTPVICLYDYYGELVPIAAIRAEFAGLYEYSLIGRAVRPLDNPKYWAFLPGGY